MIARIVRFKFDRLFLFRESFVKALQPMEDHAEIVVIARIVRFKFDRLLRFWESLVKAFQFMER